jgi:hypothetical protein
VRSAATWKFAQKISQALQAYMHAHNQQLPDSTSQLRGLIYKATLPEQAGITRNKPEINGLGGGL